MPCEGITPHPESEVHHACYNSPYGELLPALVAEIVRDVGFDGIWFDGSTFSNHSARPMSQPGCRCPFCQERFTRETGLSLPERADYDDRVFRRWMRWRYDVLMDVYRRCVEAVTAVRPDAVVVFNNYRRRHLVRFGWTTAIPMRPLQLDALMSTELDGFPGQADIQMKINLAYECKRGVETWWPLCDHWNTWVPDVEPLPAVQAALGCISAGGVSCVGVGMPAETMVESLQAMEAAAAPRMPYLGGKTIEYAAILASEQTMDFYGKDDPNLVWDEVHGANELLGHAHLQTSVIFDAHLTPERLRRCPVVIVGEAVCMSQAQAEALRDYVEGGGTLVACGRAGEWDEWGYPHPRPVLDDLLGIVARGSGEGRPTLRLRDPGLKETCGLYVTVPAPYVCVQITAEVERLADILVIPVNFGNGDPEAMRDVEGEPGLCVRRVGQGTVVYFALNVFATYLHKPTARAMRLVRTLLTRLVPPVVTLEGPQAVRVNTRIQANGEWTIHLPNSPGTAYRYPSPREHNYLHTPGEVLPVRDLRLVISGPQIERAWLALSGENLEVDRGTVTLAQLSLQEIVALKVRAG